MCAEAVWWQCHRRIIADYLMAADEIVFHIMGADRVERAEMTEGAKREPDGILTYPGLLYLFWPTNVAQTTLCVSAFGT